MATDFDSALIESVTVRRGRLTHALLYGENPTRRRWPDSLRLFLFSIAAAAAIAAICVGVAFVSNLLAEQRKAQDERARSAPVVRILEDSAPTLPT